MKEVINSLIKNIYNFGHIIAPVTFAMFAIRESQLDISVNIIIGMVGFTWTAVLLSKLMGDTIMEISKFFDLEKGCIMNRMGGLPNAVIYSLVVFYMFGKYLDKFVLI